MPLSPAEGSGQPGKKRQGRDRVDRREESRKILADFNQERRHGKSAFYPDTRDESSARKVVAHRAVLRFNASTKACPRKVPMHHFSSEENSDLTNM
jgi:hypothetical protein